MTKIFFISCWLNILLKYIFKEYFSRLIIAKIQEKKPGAKGVRAFEVILQMLLQSDDKFSYALELLFQFFQVLTCGGNHVFGGLAQEFLIFEL